ncbi:MAG: helix-hairpin-helix domain-containing protein [Dehalococcoidia bacterium]
MVKWIVAGSVTITAVLALFLLAIRSASAPPAIEVKLADAPVADGVLKVYITGAIVAPGIYQVQPGDRYADALALAGGPTDDAEPLAVNLARRVKDEDHIHVPRQGEPLTVSAAGDPILDLNTATALQLEALPGVGPVRAQQIVESRAKEGPFTSPDDLVQRKLIPQSMIEAIRGRIQVRP